MRSILDTQSIISTEIRFIQLLDRTFLKACDVDTVDYEELSKNVTQVFASKTYSLQLTKILDELISYILELNFKQYYIASATNSEYDMLTEEVVKKSADMASNISSSIIAMLQDDAIYYENPKKLASKIREYWGDEKHAAERFARTVVADITNATVREKAKADGYMYMQFSSSGGNPGQKKRAVCGICEALDGTIFDLSKDEGGDVRPPLHPNCRCSLVPYPASFKVNESQLYENKDFESMFKDKEHYYKAFKNLDLFNNKYRINKYVLDEHLQTKYYLEKGTGRLGVTKYLKINK